MTARAALKPLLVLAATWLACGCSAEPEVLPPAGNAEAGQLLLRQFACAQCHSIPGVATATGNVGPPLDNIASRVYLAGMLPNTPENLVRWIREPRDIKPGTAMPDLGVTPAHARDMAAYLSTLK